MTPINLRKNTMAKKENIASVLAFEKKLVPSDGSMYGCQWDNKSQFISPLRLNEKSVRGTISNRLKPALKKDPVALNNEVEKPNLQTVDACSLSAEQDTLVLHFTLKVLGGLRHPSACNNAAFKQSYQDAINRYLEKTGMRELAKRYALSIANARFLWRNRLGAEHIQVEVKELNDGAGHCWSFNALDFNPRDLDTTTADVDNLADRIASALASDNDFLMLEIICYAKVGKAQDVYPSEELVMDKGKGKKAKYSMQSMVLLLCIRKKLAMLFVLLILGTLSIVIKRPLLDQSQLNHMVLSPI